jgi:alpha-galactosidase
MGFNTFWAFGCNNYNETIINQQAQLMVSLGLRDAGYTYVNLDDCWSLA